MLLHAILDTVEMVLVGVYLAPPANISLLQSLVSLLAQFPTDNVILTGDFTIPLNPSIDKLSWTLPPTRCCPVGLRCMGWRMCGGRETPVRTYVYLSLSVL